MDQVMMSQDARNFGLFLQERAHNSGRCVCGSKVQALTQTPLIRAYILQHRTDCPVVLANLATFTPAPAPFDGEVNDTSPEEPNEGT